MVQPNLQLTNTQLVLLATAARRDDLLLCPPDHLKGGAVQKTIAKLLSLGLVEEVPAGCGEPAWRQDEAGQGITLKLTSAGLAAIGIDAEGDAGDTGGAAGTIEARCGAADAEQSRNSSSPATGERETGVQAAEASPAPAASPRAGSKQALIVSLLGREGGATLVELTAATGWLAHTTRAALTGLRQKGHAITRAKREDGTAIYRIVA